LFKIFFFLISLQLNLTFSNKPGSGQNNLYLILAGGSAGRLQAGGHFSSMRAQPGACDSDHHCGGQRQLHMEEKCQTECRFHHSRKAAC
uniref:Uncharacterized protein n=1 Tax=Pongo abelii TaxID=9601 RepID=A0A8I5YN71_PONAB